MNKWLLMVVGCVFIEVAVQAAKFGDPAAPLHVAQWIKGDPVDLATGTGKTVYVVEFWATWCPPCRETIPHLTELQAKFKDKGVVVVGISDEKQQKVEAFVKKMGAKMEYAVGVDDSHQTSKAYMSAYHKDAIPIAFVIDKTGAVVWAGHPMEDLSKVLEQVLAGTFAVKPEKDAAEAEEDERASLLNDYFTAASRRSGQADAIEAGKKVLSEAADDPDMLNAFAWTILTDENLYVRDYQLALHAARQAYEKSGRKQCDIVDTLARALLMTGKTNDAITLQKKAIKLCDDNFARLKLKETLESYLHPVTPDGIDDTKRFAQFVDGAAALITAKRAVSIDQLLAKTDVQPCRVQLAKAFTQPISSESLYEQARQSVLMVGTLAKGEDEGEWDSTMAAGFVIHESGIFVTNFHVLDVPEGMILAAMTADGKVYPVSRVLAVAPFPDIAICQLDGATGLKPLPVVPNAKPGAHIRVLSHPDNAFYSLTEGILSRYFVRREDGKEATMLTTTSDFAVGASGGPLFDDCGNVIGMVASTSSVYSGLDDASGEEPTPDSKDSGKGAGDLQMIMKMCVTPSDILKLVTGQPTESAKGL